MVALTRVVVTAVASLTLSQAARVAKRRQKQEDGFFRVVQGGAMSLGGPNSTGMDAFRNLPPKAVKYFSAASPDPISGERVARDYLLSVGVNDPEWIPVYGANCEERVQDPKYVRMVEEAEAIYIPGGQSGLVSACFFGTFSRSGVNNGQETPLLKTLRSKRILGGSSAGAMTQPMSEILVTAYSVESFEAVRNGDVFQRDAGSGLLGSPQAVDTHFSERGRQGRLLVFAMQTRQEWAFGVDEATSYIWRPSGVYEVTMGNFGVVVFQGANGTKDSQRARMHYLTGGDTIDVTTGTITYSADKSRCTSATVPKGSRAIFNGGRENVYKEVSIATAKAPAGTIVSNYHGFWRQVQVDFTTDDKTLAMCGPSGESFENLWVEQYSSPRRALAFSEREKPNVPEDYIYPLDD